MEQKEPTIFPEGIIFKRPREGALTFVKGNISINIRNLTNFMKKFPGNEWLNIDLKQSKEGKLYLQLNTYGLKKGTTEAQDRKFDKDFDKAQEEDINWDGLDA